MLHLGWPVVKNGHVCGMWADSLLKTVYSKSETIEPSNYLSHFSNIVDRTYIGYKLNTKHVYTHTKQETETQGPFFFSRFLS